MKIHWIRFRVNYFLLVRTLLTLGRTISFWSGNPFWLSDVMQPVTLVCVRQWAYSSSQRPLAHGGDKRHFFLIWKGNNGARNCAGSQTETVPRATLNQGRQPVFVSFYYFFFFLSNTKKAVWACSDITGVIPLFKLSSVVSSCPCVHATWVVISTEHHKNSSSDFCLGIASPLAHLGRHSHISIPSFPIFMTRTWESLCKRQLHY